LVLNAFLVSPVLIYELRVGDGGPDKTIVFLLAASVLSLLSVQVWARRALLAHALLFPLYLVVAIDLYVIGHYQMRLASGMILTIFENLEDAREYLQTHWKPMVGTLSAVLGGYALCLWKIRGLSWR